MHTHTKVVMSYTDQGMGYIPRVWMAMGSVPQKGYRSYDPHTRTHQRGRAEQAQDPCPRPPGSLIKEAGQRAKKQVHKAGTYRVLKLLLHYINDFLRLFQLACPRTEWRSSAQCYFLNIVQSNVAMQQANGKPNMFSAGFSPAAPPIIPDICHAWDHS